METLDIKFNIEDSLAKAYQNASLDVKVRLQQSLSILLKQNLQELESSSKTPKSKVDSWLDFLDNIDKFAVDTGIEDLSINHDHYLYRVPKQSSF